MYNALSVYLCGELEFEKSLDVSYSSRVSQRSNSITGLDWARDDLTPQIGNPTRPRTLNGNIFQQAYMSRKHYLSWLPKLTTCFGVSCDKNNTFNMYSEFESK